MPWANAWSGSGIVTASEVLVVDSSGNIVGSIDQVGNITGQSIYANKTFYYQGTELETLLKNYSYGAIASGFIDGSSSSRTAAAETMLVQTQFQYDNTRSIWFYVKHMLWTTSSTPGEVQLILRAKLASNGNVTTADPGIQLYSVQNNVAGYAVSVGGSINEVGFDGAPWNFANGSILNVALSAVGYNNTGGNGNVSSGDPVYIAVLDLGKRTTNANTVDLYAGGGTAPQFKSFQKNAFDSQSFQGGGAASNGSGNSPSQWMYFGEDPGYAPNGNWRSYAWYDGATGGGNGLGSLSDIVGVPAGSLTYLDVFVFEDWFYQIAGGTLYIGMTGSGVNHTSEPGGATYQILGVNFTGRGQGQWVSLLGTSIETAVLNGTFTGFVLGPGPTTSYDYYGYADGAAQPQPMAIRGGYYK